MFSTVGAHLLFLCRVAFYPQDCVVVGLLLTLILRRIGGLALAHGFSMGLTPATTPYSGSELNSGAAGRNRSKNVSAGSVNFFVVSESNGGPRFNRRHPPPVFDRNSDYDARNPRAQRYGLPATHMDVGDKSNECRNATPCFVPKAPNLSSKTKGLS